jgi:hypothetical protein
VHNKETEDFRMKKNLPYILVGVLLVIVLAVVIFVDNKPTNNEQKQATETTTPTASTPSPTPKDNTPKVDSAKAKNYFFVDLLAQGDKHINQAVTFSTKVDTLNDSGFVVNQGFGNMSGSISVAFYDPADASKIKQGDYVTVAGTITERGLANLYIKGATLVATGDSVEKKFQVEEKAYNEKLKANEKSTIDSLLAKAGSKALAYSKNCNMYLARNINNTKLKKGDKIAMRVSVRQVYNGAWLEGKTYYQCVSSAAGNLNGEVFTVYDSRGHVKVLKKDETVLILGTYQGKKKVNNQLYNTSSIVPVIDMKYVVRVKEDL